MDNLQVTNRNRAITTILYQPSNGEKAKLGRVERLIQRIRNKFTKETQVFNQNIPVIAESDSLKDRAVEVDEKVDYAYKEDSTAPAKPLSERAKAQSLAFIKASTTKGRKLEKLERLADDYKETQRPSDLKKLARELQCEEDAAWQFVEYRKGREEVEGEIGFPKMLYFFGEIISGRVPAQQDFVLRVFSQKVREVNWVTLFKVIDQIEDPLTALSVLLSYCNSHTTEYEKNTLQFEDKIKELTLQLPNKDSEAIRKLEIRVERGVEIYRKQSSPSPAQMATIRASIQVAKAKVYSDLLWTHIHIKEKVPTRTLAQTINAESSYDQLFEIANSDIEENKEKAKSLAVQKTSDEEETPPRNKIKLKI